MQRFGIGAVVVVALACASAAAQEPKQTDRADKTDKAEQEASFWMKRKLALSQDVLEGLAMGDFDKIDAAARTLDKLNSIEKFVRGRNEAYRAQLDLFRYANASLLKAAETNNLDGATLAFNQMTLSCVHCHQQLREGK